jgi:hypothetical protein
MHDHRFASSLFTLAVLSSVATVATAQSYSPPVVHSRAELSAPIMSPRASAQRSVSRSQTLTQSFGVVEELEHQDNFWQNMLTGDANHNGLQEIVTHYVPIDGAGGEEAFLFFEDDGTGQFHLVHSIPLAAGGLLAMGDIDGDGLTDLFFERNVGECDNEYVRFEASSPDGFPDHEVWSAPKEGDVVDFRGTIADTDGDGLLEFITSDGAFTCGTTSIKIFEAGHNDQMTLTYKAVTGSFAGNPVVADFDGNGKPEIAVSLLNAGILAFEAVGNDHYHLVGVTPHLFLNAYQLAVIDAHSPIKRPMLIMTGERVGMDYRVLAYQRPAGSDTFQLLSGAQLPSTVGFSIPQLYAADLFGSRTPELIVTRLGGPVAILTIGADGTLSLFDTVSVPMSEEVVATTRSASRSGAIALGVFPSDDNPSAPTVVLELE